MNLSQTQTSTFPYGVRPAAIVLSAQMMSSSVWNEFVIHDDVTWLGRQSHAPNQILVSWI
jgi:hypothetical protein